MRHTIKLLFLGLIILCSASFSNAQNLGLELTVEVTVEQIPAGALVSWSDSIGREANVYRKLTSQKEWQLVSITSHLKDYEDYNVLPNYVYEYKVELINDANSGSAYSKAYGYGILDQRNDIAMYRKEILVMVDSALGDGMKPELDVLISDLILDGFNPYLEYVSSELGVPDIKDLVTSYYYFKNIEYVYIIGHVAVPYAGFHSPDAHQDHLGAWPSDGYYADINADRWSENTFFNYTNERDERNSNRVNDGKFDQNIFPTEVEIVISRVDFSNLPSFSYSELELTKRYLSNASARKHGLLQNNGKALVQDSLMTEIEGFGNNFYRNFDPIIGRDNLVEGDFLQELSKENYFAALATSFAGDTIAYSIASTADVAATPTNAMLKLLSGSYFGDWDTRNNFLRANLASGNTLNVLWVGRPNYFLHQLVVNSTIGECYKMSCNNGMGNTATYEPRGTYVNNTAMSLLGDPTIRIAYGQTAVRNLAIEEKDSIIKLSWNFDPTLDVNGVVISKYNEQNKKYEIVATLGPSEMSYREFVTEVGTYNYIVNPFYIEEKFQVPYQNYSLGQIASIKVEFNETVVNVNYPSDISLSATTIFNELVEFEVDLEALDSGVYVINLQRKSENGLWESVGDKEITKENLTNTAYKEYFYDSLILNQPTRFRAHCIFKDSTIFSNDTVLTYNVLNPLSVYPNPCLDGLITIDGDSIVKEDIRILDVKGSSHYVDYNETTQILNLVGYRKGLYLVIVKGSLFKVSVLP